MAKKTIVLLQDDLLGDGTAADETVRFGLDGADYEIDLTNDNAKALRDALADYVAAGTRTARTRRTPATAAHPVSPVSPRRTAPAKADKEQNKAIRAWAQSKGIKMSDRGRIPTDIVERYHAEAGKPAVADAAAEAPDLTPAAGSPVF